jgi:DNA invertase Pin-like site-specific DNA recombinase
MKVLRCAVYTRKSTEDGLEQEFNSLHAQREACEAFILSQRHEGWTLMPGNYDDGGFSGGNMERPGLKALMAQVDAGLVDVIVVYKVDRLTRSLADFAKIVDRLDARQASFVSVTQAFNTTSSMGRLTLNVLLSFAQFEREVTGERIRDKIAASKKKGMWMGGPVPLGYEVRERKLVVSPEEAKRVCTIMRRYLEIQSVPALIELLRSEGIRTKVQPRTSGPHRGGIPFARGSLFHLLKNPVYRGKIVHKGQVHDGEHEAIVDEALWAAVQQQLARKAPPRRRDSNDPQEALLRDLLSDPEGRPMVPTYGTKGTRRYCYYETRKDLAKPGSPSATRFQRGQLERHVIQHIVELLEDEHRLRRVTGVEEAEPLKTMFIQAKMLAAELQHRSRMEVAVRSLVRGVRIGKGNIMVAINPDALACSDTAALDISIPPLTRKPFREAKLRIDGAAEGGKPDEQLVKLVADAAEAQRLVFGSPELSLNALGKREGRCRTQLGRLLRLSWLSPRVVEMIAAGKQPRGLTRARLLSDELPMDWVEQERLLGCAA